MGVMAARGKFTNGMGLSIKNTLRPTKGQRVNHHGTTSGSPAPHDAGLTVSKNTFRCTGRTRLSLLHVRESHSGRYLGGFSRCLAPTGSSLAEKFSLTSSHRSVISCILTNIGDLSSILSRNQHPKWLVKGATSVFHFHIAAGFHGYPGWLTAGKAVQPQHHIPFAVVGVAFCLLCRIKKVEKDIFPGIRILRLDIAVVRFPLAVLMENRIPRLFID